MLDGLRNFIEKLCFTLYGIKVDRDITLGQNIELRNLNRKNTENEELNDTIPQHRNLFCWPNIKIYSILTCCMFILPFTLFLTALMQLFVCATNNVFSFFSTFMSIETSTMLGMVLLHIFAVCNRFLSKPKVLALVIYAILLLFANSYMLSFIIVKIYRYYDPLSIKNTN